MAVQLCEQLGQNGGNLGRGDVPPPSKTSNCGTITYSVKGALPLQFGTRISLFGGENATLSMGLEMIMEHLSTIMLEQQIY